MSYVYYIRKLKRSGNKLDKIVINSPNVKELYEILRNDGVLSIGWVRNDPKACRMYVNWLVFLYNKIWRVRMNLLMKDTLMIVDGHVGKVLQEQVSLERLGMRKIVPI